MKLLTEDLKSVFLIGKKYRIFICSPSQIFVIIFGELIFFMATPKNPIDQVPLDLRKLRSQLHLPFSLIWTIDQIIPESSPPQIHK